MVIKNLTKGKIISAKAESLDDVFSKSIGLMFSFKQNKSFIFKFQEEKIIALHMLFVFYPIDVLFLSKNKTVVDKKENFMPFTFYKSKRKAIYAIEMPSGAIKKTKTVVGDKIGF